MKRPHANDQRVDSSARCFAERSGGSPCPCAHRPSSGSRARRDSHSRHGAPVEARNDGRASHQFLGIHSGSPRDANCNGLEARKFLARLELECSRKEHVVAKVGVTIERQMRAVDGNVVDEQTTKSFVRGASERSRLRPEQSMVNYEQLGARRHGSVDCREGRIHRNRDVMDRTRAVHLKSVDSTGIVRGSGRVEYLVEIRDDRRQRHTCSSVCSFPALTSSQFPMYDLRMRTDGLAARAPFSKATKLSFTGGNSVPPITPRIPVFDRLPATRPARKDASAKANSIPATLAPLVLLDVVT